ncbi:GATA zinc finger domain-containing protein 14-like isoform X1 [Rhagoletis pomonella]|uniref:GATA zinc finger domain-containing protein 14-like isoform X1 n=1 Tax=Rhagoletis pomonella TaxID=28610 RepID=UPI00177CFB49|nr:GATA zinc finger domain-containing protein 14-like isoform X1 [Rhagoletis pomonella]
MVLTNFECWAHGGGAVVGSDGFALDSRHVDMFNTRMVQQRLNNATGIAAVSHISSNGYYGFSYVNAAHESADDNSHNNNNNNDNINNTNINLNNNNNNNNRCVPNANNVNGMPLIHHNNNHSSSMNVSAISVDAGFPAAAAAAATFGTQRCKKRYFASDDDYANCDLLNGCDSGVGADGRDVCVAAAAKRCRFDDDYAAAQYCNDFFSLPSTQIGTQSCLMDTEDTQQLQQQQQQPQVDVNMDAANLTNQTINNATTKRHRQAIDYDTSYVNINLSNNINAANQNNIQISYNNHNIERLASNAATGRRENGGSDNNDVISEGDQDNVHAGVGHTYQLNSAGIPAHIKATSHEDSTSTANIAALYAKTHGGAFYQFTAGNAGNQPYVEDI